MIRTARLMLLPWDALAVAPPVLGPGRTAGGRGAHVRERRFLRPRLAGFLGARARHSRRR